MRHGRRIKRLSRTSEHYEATLAGMARNMIQHGRIRTTLTKAKLAQPYVDRLITLGKDGSVHARRRAFRLLQDRDMIKELFSEIAPRFQDCRGGYTRILKLGYRHGDGAKEALFELARLPIEPSKPAPKAKAEPAPESVAAGKAEAAPAEENRQKPKRFLEGLRERFRPKK